MLARHLHTQEILLQEVDEVLGGQQPTQSDIPKLRLACLLCTLQDLLLKCCNQCVLKTRLDPTELGLILPQILGSGDLGNAVVDASSIHCGPMCLPKYAIRTI